MDANQVLLEDSRALLRQMIRLYGIYKRGTIVDEAIDFEQELSPEQIQQLKQAYLTRKDSLIDKVNSVSAQ